MFLCPWEDLRRVGKRVRWGSGTKTEGLQGSYRFFVFLFIYIYLFILFYFYPVYSPTNVAFWLVKDDKSSRFDKN